MIAEKTFKKLGYTLQVDNEEEMVYYLDDSLIVTYITFDKEEGIVEKSTGGYDLELLQVCIQQLKELSKPRDEAETWRNLPPTQKQLNYIEMNLDHIDMDEIKTRGQASDAITKGKPLFIERDNWGDN